MKDIMKHINDKIQDLLLLALSLTTDKGAPSMKNRMLEKLSNLCAFFTLSTLLDGFVFKTAKDQRDQESKLAHFASFMSFLLESGLTPEGLSKAYNDCWKYSKSRTFKNKTPKQEAVDELLASGETAESLAEDAEIDTFVGTVKLEAQQALLQEHSSYLQGELIRQFNESRNGNGVLGLIPTFFAKSIANKINETVHSHRVYLKKGIIKGIKASGGDLFIINKHIIPQLDTDRIFQLCLAMEQETNEPNQDGEDEEPPIDFDF